jgi:hypothetical protein
MRKDAFVAALVKNPAEPPQIVELRGFLGDSSKEGFTRLYFSSDLATFLDLPDADILHSVELPKEQSPLGGSVVWVLAESAAFKPEAPVAGAGEPAVAGVMPVDTGAVLKPRIRGDLQSDFLCKEPEPPMRRTWQERTCVLPMCPTNQQGDCSSVLCTDYPSCYIHSCNCPPGPGVRGGAQGDPAAAFNKGMMGHPGINLRTPDSYCHSEDCTTGCHTYDTATCFQVCGRAAGYNVREISEVGRSCAWCPSIDSPCRTDDTRTCRPVCGQAAGYYLREPSVSPHSCNCTDPPQCPKYGYPYDYPAHLGGPGGSYGGQGMGRGGFNPYY